MFCDLLYARRLIIVDSRKAIYTTHNTSQYTVVYNARNCTDLFKEVATKTKKYLPNFSYKFFLNSTSSQQTVSGIFF